MSYNYDLIQELRTKRTLLLIEHHEAKTEYVKNSIYSKLKAVNKQLFKETKNTIYL